MGWKVWMRSSVESAAYATPTLAITRRIASTAVLIAVGTVLGLVESWFAPALPLPWVRLGLGNIATLIALGGLGPAAALAVSVGRAVMVGLASGSLVGPAAAMAGAGALSAWGAMCWTRDASAHFTVIGWSAAGAFAHTTVQFLVAMALLDSTGVLSLLPLSLLASLALGVATGNVARIVLSRIPTEMS